MTPIGPRLPAYYRSSESYIPRKSLNRDSVFYNLKYSEIIMNLI